MVTDEQITQAYDSSSKKYATPEKQLTAEGEAIAKALIANPKFKKHINDTLIDTVAHGPTGLVAGLMRAFLAGLELGRAQQPSPEGEPAASLEGQ